MRVNKYDDTEAGFERITRPTAGRFRQSTVHAPRNTRRDRTQATRKLVELGLSGDQIREA
jgi:hypothetical protein